MRNKEILLIITTLMLLVTTPAQAVMHRIDVSAVEITDADIDFNGTVVDKETGEELIGVTIAIKKGTSIVGGTATNADGKFSLKITEKDYTVQISYTGYKTIILRPKDIKSGMKIQMESDSKLINEVVVTGFFDKNKNTFTGSVTQLKAEDLKLVTGTDIVSAIAALTPGLQLQVNSAQGSNPNYVPELIMRGMSSFSNDGQGVNQPTIILDGTEISMTDLYDLDMNEIESINVLKDASATALYGSKASNGVIVITRKPITSGTIHVAYNFTGNVQYPKLNDYQLLSPSEKLEYERLAGLYDAHKSIDPATGLPLQYKYDELYNERYKRIQAGQNSDWLSQPARIAFSHDHSLRVYGGAADIRYELTGRFANTLGVMKDDYRRRYNIGFKLDYFINNSIKISNRSTYAEVYVKDTPYGSFSQYARMNPYDPMYNEDGTVNLDLSWDLDNPLYEATLGSFSNSDSRTFSNSTDLRWEINKMFRITGHFNVSSGRSSSSDFTSPKSRAFKNELDLSKRGSLQRGYTTDNSYSGNIVGSFNKMFEDESLISASAGWEINYSKSRSEYITAIGFYNDQLSFIGNAAGYPTTTPSGVQGESSDVGMFLSANYSFRNRYFVDGTWRLTGSSQFGENNRYGNFWSAGLGWNIMNESFMKAIKKSFDVFKLRASTGYTGKVSFSPFQAMTMYQYSNRYEYKNGIGAVPMTIGNVDLAWERTMNYNLGLDLSMFDHRLNFVVDAYIRNTKDLLLNKSMAPSTGVTSAMGNLGELQNKGVELQLDGYIFRTLDFNWKLGVTGYWNRNKITKINEALKEMNKRNQEMASSYNYPLPQYAEGESVTALKLVRSAGIDPATGKEVYIKLNGEKTFTYDATDKVLIGDTQPLFNGTFNTSLYWKGFSVYALFDIRMGGYIYNTTRASKVEGSNPKYNADQRVFDDRWKQPGDIAMYKNIADSSTPRQTDRFAEKENTLNLGTLNFTYDFSQSLCKRIHLRNLRCGINFTDIFRISSVKIERGTDYLYSKGFEINVSAIF
ncbi:MAG: SusC/RagA family TonB-linked outer membrane protein [Prevotellaceae bacterium]|nr:SusC/RagA family TonB-linked outer membrane protein [Candidatus Colivivens equi]